MRSGARILVPFVAFLLLAGPIAADPPAGDCIVGPGPAATLLFPYFEVDLADPFDVTTLLSIGTGCCSSVLVRVVLWTDWGWPTFAFDVFLKQWQTQTFNMRDVFNGYLPITGYGEDLSGFPACDAQPPWGYGRLTEDEQAQLAAAHTGVEGPLDPGVCYGAPYGDQVARGYITADVVSRCSGRTGLSSPTYKTPLDGGPPYFTFGGEEPIATNQNRLWGDVIYANAGEASAQGSEAVAIWADPVRIPIGSLSFYGRYYGYDGRDHRVPLPRAWSQRFFNGGPFAGGADLIVWRDVGQRSLSLTPCGSFPDWYPRATSAYNHAITEDASQVFDLGRMRFPLVTQRVSVDSLDIPFDYGSIQIAGSGAVEQMWVQPTLRASGEFSVAWNGAPFLFNCGTAPLVP